MESELSIFSGHEIARGKGRQRVAIDGHVMNIRGKKEKKLIERKINPRDIRWTLPSREFFGKHERYVTDTSNQIKVDKTNSAARGYRNIGVLSNILGKK